MTTPENPATDAGTTQPAGEGVSDAELEREVDQQTSSDLKVEDVYESQGDAGQS